MPTISVIIPVYNVKQYLNECVESVLRQSFRDLEIILVDDGSTDNSGTMCDAYPAVDSRIRVIHQANGGLSAARNAGLSAATGEYVYFLDSDDYIEDCAMEHLLNVIQEERADFVFFDGYVFFDGCEENPAVSRYERQRKYVTKSGREQLLLLLQTEEYRTAVPLMLFRRGYLRRNDLCFLEGILHEDELFTFLAFNADGRVAHCHEQLYARRIRPGSIMTASGLRRRYESMLQIYQELSLMFHNGSAAGEAARMYMIRTAKSVLGKYQLLPAEEQEDLQQEHIAFKKDVMSHHGFGDMKLKIKCAGWFMNKVYRAEYKLLRNFSSK